MLEAIGDMLENSVFNESQPKGISELPADILGGIKANKNIEKKMGSEGGD